MQPQSQSQEKDVVNEQASFIAAVSFLGFGKNGMESFDYHKGKAEKTCGSTLPALDGGADLAKIMKGLNVVIADGNGFNSVKAAMLHAAFGNAAPKTLSDVLLKDAKNGKGCIQAILYFKLGLLKSEYGSVLGNIPFAGKYMSGKTTCTSFSTPKSIEEYLAGIEDYDKSLDSGLAALLLEHEKVAVHVKGREGHTHAHSPSEDTAEKTDAYKTSSNGEVIAKALSAKTDSSMEVKMADLSLKANGMSHLFKSNGEVDTDRVINTFCGSMGIGGFNEKTVSQIGTSAPYEFLMDSVDTVKGYTSNLTWFMFGVTLVSTLIAGPGFAGLSALPGLLKSAITTILPTIIDEMNNGIGSGFLWTVMSIGVLCGILHSFMSNSGSEIREAYDDLVTYDIEVEQGDQKFRYSKSGFQLFGAAAALITIMLSCIGVVAGLIKQVQSLVTGASRWGETKIFVSKKTYDKLGGYAFFYGTDTADMEVATVCSGWGISLLNEDYHMIPLAQVVSAFSDAKNFLNNGNDDLKKFAKTLKN